MSKKFMIILGDTVLCKIETKQYVSKNYAEQTNFRYAVTFDTLREAVQYAIVNGGRPALLPVK